MSLHGLTFARLVSNTFVSRDVRRFRLSWRQALLFLRMRHFDLHFLLFLRRRNTKALRSLVPLEKLDFHANYVQSPSCMFCALITARHRGFPFRGVVFRSRWHALWCYDQRFYCSRLWLIPLTAILWLALLFGAGPVRISARHARRRQAIYGVLTMLVPVTDCEVHFVTGLWCLRPRTRIAKCFLEQRSFDLKIKLLWKRWNIMFQLCAVNVQ